MDTPYEPLVFIRSKLHLHALMVDRQAWFCARDLGRLMGVYLDERQTRKLDPDQRRTLPLRYYRDIKEIPMVSESGAYALLLHHHHPANSQLRQWITHHVMPTLLDTPSPAHHNNPTPARLEWQGSELSVIHWQNEAWIRLRDMPSLLPGRDAMHTKAEKWWGVARRLIRPGRSTVA